MRRSIIVAAGVVAIGVSAVILLRPRQNQDPARPRTAAATTAPLDERLASADASAGARLFAACAACHSVGRGGADVDGPNLFGVVGNRVAERRPRYNYSGALRRIGGTWTPDRLDGWLTNPAAFAPGTTMGFPGLPDPQDRADVIAFLAERSQKPAR